MCFSAHASFTTAGTLAIIGLVTVKIAIPNKKLLPLAASPLFFALQQACEGIVWITITKGDTLSILHLVGVYGFLFFASTWWPIWIPYAAYYAEHSEAAKKLLLRIIIVGVITAIALFSSWVFYTTGAIVINHHIDYPVDHYPFNITNTYLAQGITYTIMLFYCIATVAPFFTSNIACTKIIGIAIAIGLVTSYIFYTVAFPSVWCFFAAIISLFLVFVIEKQIKYPNQS